MNTGLAFSDHDKHYQFLAGVFDFRERIPESVRRCLETDHTTTGTGTGTGTSHTDQQTLVLNNIIFLFQILRAYRPVCSSKDLYTDVAQDLGNWPPSAVVEARDYFGMWRVKFLQNRWPRVDPYHLGPDVSRKLTLLSFLVDDWRHFDLPRDLNDTVLRTTVRQNWKHVYRSTPNAILEDSFQLERRPMASTNQQRHELPCKPCFTKPDPDSPGSRSGMDMTIKADTSHKVAPGQCSTLETAKSPDVVVSKPVYKAKRTPAARAVLPRMARPCPLQNTLPATEVPFQDTSPNTVPLPTAQHKAVGLRPDA